MNSTELTNHFVSLELVSCVDNVGDNGQRMQSHKCQPFVPQQHMCFTIIFLVAENITDTINSEILVKWPWVLVLVLVLVLGIGIGIGYWYVVCEYRFSPQPPPIPIPKSLV